MASFCLPRPAFEMTSLPDHLDDRVRHVPPKKPPESWAHASERLLKEQCQWLDQLPAAVLVSQAGRVRYANTKASELFLAVEPHALRELGLEDLLCAPAGNDAPVFACRLNGVRFHAEVISRTTTFDGQNALLHWVRDVDYEQRLEKSLQRKHTAVQELTGRLIETQERERRHIARELHDEIGQCLSAIRVQFAKLQRCIHTPDALHLIDSAASLTERTLGRVRSLSLLLHPPQLETLGLGAALRWHLKEQERLHDWRIDFDVDELGVCVPTDVSIAVYRIVQESLSNARSHGGACAVSVRLAALPHALAVDVVDDGCGFHPEDAVLSERPTLGLLGMTERARLLGGKLTVTSAPGQGTRVSAVFPWRSGQPG